MSQHVSIQVTPLAQIAGGFFMQRVTIIGGGVIGLSIARHLSNASYAISIIDRSTPRMNASYAAGGMLGAQNEFFEDTPLYRLAMKSRTLMPHVAQQLHHDTGIDIEFQCHGLIKMATELKQIPNIHKQYAFLKQDDHDIQWFHTQDLRQMFPHLNPNTTAAFKIQDDGQIHANLYTQALTKAILTQKNVRYHAHTEVTHLKRHLDGYTVQTSQGDLKTDILVIAAGAWSGKLFSHLNVSLNTRPVKGDVKLVETDAPILKTTLFNTNGCYIVPKRHNRYLIGATSEWDNWSMVNNENNLKWLDDKSQEMLPQLRHHRTIKTWTGIRPITHHEIPIMGSLSPNLFVATGHYRNGILLSPIVGTLLAGAIQGDTHAVQTLQPFTPNVQQN